MDVYIVGLHLMIYGVMSAKLISNHFQYSDLPDPLPLPYCHIGKALVTKLFPYKISIMRWENMVFHFHFY